MYNNETGKHEYFEELDNGQWLVPQDRRDRRLWIVPVPGAVMEIEGPDGHALDMLNEICRQNDGLVPQSYLDFLELQEVPHGLRRFSAEDGYYCA